MEKTPSERGEGDGPATERTPFGRYMDAVFTDAKSFFREWDFVKIEQDVAAWNVRPKWVSVYLIANGTHQRGSSYYMGCSEDLPTRLGQHNGYVRGGPSDTRKSMGKWVLCFFAKLPPLRNFRGKDVIKECKGGRGGVAGKVIKCATVMMSRGVRFRISKKMLEKESKLYQGEVEEFLRVIRKGGYDTADVFF